MIAIRHTPNYGWTLLWTLLAVLMVCSSASANHKKLKRVSVAQTGSITVYNPTHFHFQIQLDGRTIATVEPEGALMLEDAPIGKHIVTAVYPGKLFIPPQKMRATLRLGESVRLQLETPVGKIRIHNRQGVKTSLLIDGKKRSVLKPGVTKVIRDIPIGRHQLQLVGRFGPIATGTVYVPARGHVVWSPPTAVGALRIRNYGQPSEVIVRIDGTHAGTVARGRSLLIYGVPEGLRQVQLFSPNKRPVVRHLRVHTDQTTAWIYAPKPNVLAATDGIYSPAHGWHP